MTDIDYRCQIDNEDMMFDLAAKLATICSTNTIIYLSGELGAGKTTFVRGFLEALGHKGPVKSPTFTLVESYQFPQKIIYHFDLYRLNDPEELELMGIRDYFTEDAISFIEWPEQGEGILPPPDLCCYIDILGHQRNIRIVAKTEQGKNMIKYLDADAD